MNEVAPQLDLDVGVLNVTFRHEPEAPPTLRTVEAPTPNNPHFQLQLKEVLYMPASQEQRLLLALQPNISNRDILQPWNFNAMTEQAIQWLEKKSSGSESATPRTKLRSATRTLRDFDGLAKTLRRFLHALHRG